MGTNFYVRTPPSCGGKCETHCHGEEIHLGKSSAGWAFTFRAYPDPAYAPEMVTWEVKDFEAWHRLLTLGAVFDEYGKPWTAEELLVKIEGKRGGHSELYGDAFYDDAGNAFYPGEFS